MLLSYNSLAEHFNVHLWLWFLGINWWGSQSRITNFWDWHCYTPSGPYINININMFMPMYWVYAYVSSWCHEERKQDLQAIHQTGEKSQKFALCLCYDQVDTQEIIKCRPTNRKTIILGLSYISLITYS